MGTTGAMGMAEGVAEGTVSLDSALYWHLTSNHFPPIDASFIPAAKQAIEWANDELWDARIEMPNGRTLSVSKIVEGMHLEPFLMTDDDG